MISSETKFRNPYWDYNFDLYKFPSGETGEYHYVHSRGSTFIIPRLQNKKYVLTKQFRYLNQKTSIEFPGGGIKPGLSFESNAFEELSEETGFTTDRLIPVGWFNPFNGATNEICSVFFAQNLIKSVAKPEQSEEFELLFLSEIDILNFIKQGVIWDGMTLAAWSLFYFSGLKEI